jgi:hypothetical protein
MHSDTPSQPDSQKDWLHRVSTKAFGTIFVASVVLGLVVPYPGKPTDVAGLLGSSLTAPVFALLVALLAAGVITVLGNAHSKTRTQSIFFIVWCVACAALFITIRARAYLKRDDAEYRERVRRSLQTYNGDGVGSESSPDWIPLAALDDGDVHLLRGWWLAEKKHDYSAAALEFSAAERAGLGLQRAATLGKTTVTDLGRFEERPLYRVALSPRASGSPDDFLGASQHHGFIDRSGTLVIQPAWDYCKDFSEGLAAFKKGGKWGFIDQDGNEKIAPQWASVRGSFREGTAAVCDAAGKWGIIDRDGNMLVHPAWAAATPFHQGRAVVTDSDGSQRIVSSDGEISAGRWKSVSFFAEGFAVIQNEDGFYGLMNRAGKIVIEPRLKCLDPYSEGLAKIEDFDGKVGFLGYDGVAIQPAWSDASNFSEGRAMVTFSGPAGQEQHGFIDTTGRLLFDLHALAPSPTTRDTYLSAYNFSEGLAEVSVHVYPKEGDFERRSGYIDREGQIVIPLQWESAGPFCEGIATVYRQRKYGYIDKSGAPVTPIRWDYAGRFDNDLAPVLERIDRTARARLSYVNRDGVVIWSKACDYYPPPEAADRTTDVIIGADGTDVGDALGEGKSGSIIAFPLGTDVFVRMVWCGPGVFTMGSPQTERSREPNEDQVGVTITQGFWLAKYECTNKQWLAVMPHIGTDRGVHEPAQHMLTAEIFDCVRKLNQKSPLPNGWHWSLPTEAQWEYACRAGTSTRAWFGEIDDHTHMSSGTDCGLFPANPWGFYDMPGNAKELTCTPYLDKMVGGFDPGQWDESANFFVVKDDEGRAAFRTSEPTRTGDKVWLLSRPRVGFRLAIVRD